jgi:hypothetical protein
MYVLMVIGLVVCAIGRLKLTPSITLEGIGARWYGLILFATAIPFYWLMTHLYLLVLPRRILHDSVWLMLISIVTVISYVVLLALPFRERKT